MKLLFRQRFFSWFDSYDIYDEWGASLFTVKGQLSWGHRLEIYDTQDRYLGQVKEEVLTFLPRFALYLGERCIGQIKREFTLFRPSYTLDCNGWRVEGDWLGWNYQVLDAAGREIARVYKEPLHWTDTYVIEVAEQGNVLLALMIVLAIDAANCSNG
ncbi:LURP-one-related family protein [bacterium 210820-DFI.6.52]|uniref:LURP-one-related/scramblase family protein n=1 Tax=Bittarella massiliensis (ex Durand et al. 2017) TaxID=1720313 RepID=UPI00073EDA29|nr:LURP-one-related family protein [Bittarella massiliensis (ex Durand et al. 2017)]MCB5940774.1 LURP-one-related family protein [bacterium 210820-DFI.6.52]